jgi:hypothetical protein
MAGQPDVWFVDSWIQKNWPTLAIFYRCAMASTALLRAAWDAGPINCPNDWFDPRGVEGAS